MPENPANGGKTREGLLLCMMLVASLDETPHPEETREIALIAGEEPEFSRLSAAEFDGVLSRVKKDLHRKPDELVTRIVELLETEASRRRGLELAVRIVIADGIVNPDHAVMLEKLTRAFSLPREVLDGHIVAAQRRLVRFMMIYLIYLTAASDARLSAEEFEEMIPLVLSLPAFKGVTTDQFAFISHSVRSHLQMMREEWGIDYITGTLLKASELLHDSTIPEQACRIVARGIFADGKVAAEERDFFVKLCKKLGLPKKASEELIAATVGEVEKRSRKR